MQNIQINDDIATQLEEMAKQEQVSATQLMERLVKNHQSEKNNYDQLKEFFNPYRKDLSSFKFDRESANER